MTTFPLYRRAMAWPHPRVLMAGPALALALFLTACNGSSGNGGSDENDTDESQTFFTISTLAGAGGSISPESKQAESGEVVAFDVTAEAGYELTGVGGCEGELSGTTYTTGPIEADCTITAEFDTLAPEPGIALRVAAMEEVELGTFGPALMNGLSLAYINAKGDVSLRSTMRDLNHDTISGGASYVLLPADGGAPEPYFGSFLTIPQYPDATPSHGNPGVSRSAPAPDGSVSAMITFEESGTEFAAAVRYHEGDYEVLIEPDDVPGLTGFNLRADIDRHHSFRFNESGQAALQIRVEDPHGQNTVAWLHGEPDNLEPGIVWGEGTGMFDPTYGEYLFRWPFLSVGNSNPAIAADGTLSIFASTKTDRDSHPEEEFTTRRAIWTVTPGQDDPDTLVVSRTPFTNQKSGGLEEFTDIEPGNQEQGYSLNDNNQIAMLNGYFDSTTKRDLWFIDDGDYWPIARHGSVAPNTDQVGVTTGATFGRIGVPALSNTGLMTFQAEVEGNTSLWVADLDETRPVAIEGMAAPGLDNIEFNRIGLDALPPLDAPFINNNDQVIFLAELINTDTASTVDSLWSYDQCDGLWLIAMEGQEIELEGVPVVVGWENGQAVRETVSGVRTLRGLDTPPFHAGTGPTGPNTGQLYPLNDNGQFVFIGELEGEYSTGLISEGDTGTYNRQDVVLQAQLPHCES